MVLLESEQFLTQLTRLFRQCQLSSSRQSVFIILKKYDRLEGFDPSDKKCLLRATDGKKKLTNMHGLKKRDKTNMSKKSKTAHTAYTTVNNTGMLAALIELTFTDGASIA
uniref:Signal recognition particle 14 kDa protein n=1 Tax=Microcebus murinus TaxID=30608 RepID=A0A8C5YHX9_MICMU